jgi:hypothetical protein
MRLSILPFHKEVIRAFIDHFSQDTRPQLQRIPLSFIYRSLQPRQAPVGVVLQRPTLGQSSGFMKDTIDCSETTLKTVSESPPTASSAIAHYSQGYSYRQWDDENGPVMRIGPASNVNSGSLQGLESQSDSPTIQTTITDNSGSQQLPDIQIGDTTYSPELSNPSQSPQQSSTYQPLYRLSSQPYQVSSQDITGGLDNLSVDQPNLDLRYQIHEQAPKPRQKGEPRRSPWKKHH